MGSGGAHGTRAVHGYTLGTAAEGLRSRARGVQWAQRGAASAEQAKLTDPTRLAGPAKVERARGALLRVAVCAPPLSVRAGQATPALPVSQQPAVEISNVPRANIPEGGRNNAGTSHDSTPIASVSPPD